MTQDTQPKLYNLSRRKMLAGLGAVGLASAGAGLGTTAFFSDEEEFTGNTLVAGELDLKVDWQQRYYSGQDGEELDDPSTWAALGAYPDFDEDGLQDVIQTRRYIRDNPGEFDLGSDPTPEEVEDAYRNQFADRNDQSAPVIQLDDVKPGDCGDITMSMHLFDNPGYIWMGGELTDNSENGVSDAELHDIPEGAEDDPLGPNSGTSTSGELADLVQASLFYDVDCDNEFDEANQPCVVFVVDISESMLVDVNGDNASKLEGVGVGLQTLLGNIATNGQLPFEVGLELFPGDLVTDNGTFGEIPLTTDYAAGDDLFEAIETMASPSSTDIAAANNPLDLGDAIEDGGSLLADCPDDTTQRVMAILTNGLGADNSDAEGSASTVLANDLVDEFITLGVATQSTDVDTTLENIAFLTPPAAYYDTDNGSEAEATITDGSSGIASIIGDAVVGGDEMILEGTLTEVLDALNTPSGVLLDGDFTTDGTIDCYQPEGRYCVALKWCLPLEVGNEVQSDSASFDLRFYTEQCRHNDGPETKTPFAG